MGVLAEDVKQVKLGRNQPVLSELVAIWAKDATED
jgi:hypothetical protein